MNPGASRQQAFGAMRELLAYGMVRTTPRWWTTGHAEDGTRYVYSDLDPDVCLVVVGDAVATVLTRQLCLPVVTKAVRRPARSRRRPQAYSRARNVDALFDDYESLSDDLAEVA